MDTGRGASQTRICWQGPGEDKSGVGRSERDNMGGIPDVGDGGMEATNHIAIYVPM